MIIAYEYIGYDCYCYQEKKNDGMYVNWLHFNKTAENLIRHYVLTEANLNKRH